MPLSAGTRLGPYEIVTAIGAGGMGEVYKARDTRLERTVAIKVLPPALAADPEFRARFEREAKSISALNHPHICTLYDVGDSGRRLRTSSWSTSRARRWRTDSRRDRCRSIRRLISRARSPMRSTRRIATASSIAI